MKMTNMRVHIDKINVRVYDDLKAITGEDFHVLFFLCICLAVSRNTTPKPIARKTDKFWSSTMSAMEWSCIYTIILAQNGMHLKSVEIDEDVILQIEAIANAGVDIITNDLLKEYIRNVDGIKSLYVSDNNGEIIKAILYSIVSDYMDKVE